MRTAGLYRPAALVMFLGVLLLCARPSSAGEITHKRFMKEFARSVQGVVEDEPAMRRKMAAFALKHKDLLRDGFGSHPEIFPEMFRDAGIEKLNCISGRYYVLFEGELNNEERRVFYDTKQGLTQWVSLIAYEETIKNGVIKSPYSLAFRRQGDIPSYVAEKIKMDIKPYLSERLTGEDMQGRGFDGLVCGE